MLNFRRFPRPSRWMITRILHNLFQEYRVVIGCSDRNDSAAPTTATTEHNKRVTDSIRNGDGKEIEQNVERQQKGFDEGNPFIFQ